MWASKENSVRFIQLPSYLDSDFDSTTVTMGRGIRRLISLFESVDEIINEADRRIQAESDGHEPVVPTTDEESEEQEA
jgi:hypothetical protein